MLGSGGGSRSLWRTTAHVGVPGAAGLPATGSAHHSSPSGPRSSLGASAGAPLRRAWYVATTFNQDRMLEYGLWAAGALTIGLGDRARSWPGSPSSFALGESAAAGYDGARDRHGRLDRDVRPLHGGQGRVPVDRLRQPDAGAQPHLSSCRCCSPERRCSSSGDGGAAWAVVARRRARPLPRHATPYSPDAVSRTTRRTGSRSPHSQTGSSAGRTDTIEHALVVVTVVATALLAAAVAPARGSLQARGSPCSRRSPPRRSRGRERRRCTPPTERPSSRKRLYDTLPKPANWLDRATDGRPVVFLGLAVADANPINLLEFWNRSIKGVWSLDGYGAGTGSHGDAGPRRAPTARSLLPERTTSSRFPAST